MAKTKLIDVTKKSMWEHRARVFKDGFMDQAMDGTTLLISTMLGIGQGLKYKGSLKTGIITGLIIEGVFGSANGIKRLYEYTRSR